MIIKVTEVCFTWVGWPPAPAASPQVSPAALPTRHTPARGRSKQEEVKGCVMLGQHTPEFQAM